MKFLFIGDTARSGVQCGKEHVSYMDAEMEELVNFLGLNSKVNNFTDDPLILNYFEFEQGRVKPIVKGRLKSALPYWRDVIGAPESVLQIVSYGIKIDF